MSNMSEEKNRRLKEIEDKYAKIIMEMGEKEYTGEIILDNGTTRFKAVMEAFLRECKEVENL